MYQRELPFPRGTTWSDGGGTGMTIANVEIEHLLGTEYTVKDTEHGTGVDIVLRLLKNDGDADITFDNQLLQFDTGAKDYGRVCTVVTDTAGQPCIPIDDFYADSFVIPDNDYFYGVVRGPCNIKTEAGAITHAVVQEVICDDSGYLYGAAASAGQFLIGTVDQGGSTSSTAVLVNVDLWMGGWRGS